MSLSQESCARVLLFRGADKTIQNFANQDAFQVAVIAGNSELAEVIRHFRPEDVGEYFALIVGYNSNNCITYPNRVLSSLLAFISKLEEVYYYYIR